MSVRRLASALLAAFGFAALATAPALACSPPLVPPTVRDLGPDQVAVIGTIGERVAGGRLFHVERWFNGRAAMTPIVIAFKEGPAVGDCSYPVTTGQRLIIFPAQAPDGTLAADLGTLQAHPDTELGRQYVREARELYGAGVVPDPLHVVDEGGATSSPSVAAVIAGTAVAVLVLFGALALAARRRNP